MQRTLNKSFWNNRWKTGKTGWDIGYASPAIMEYFKKVQNKNIQILIPGCGNAYEAESLYQLGFQDITILDISDEAVNKLHEKFQHQDGIQVICQDFFEHDRQYDFIVEQTFFCALQPQLREKYVLKMHRLLKENGTLIGLLFNTEFEKNGPPFGGNIDEYQKLFQNYFKINHLTNATHSIPQRQNREVFIEFIKK